MVLYLEKENQRHREIQIDLEGASMKVPLKEFEVAGTQVGPRDGWWVMEQRFPNLSKEKARSRKGRTDGTHLGQGEERISVCERRGGTTTGLTKAGKVNSVI